MIMIGAVMIGSGCEVSLAIGIEDGRPYLSPPNTERIAAGVFTTAIGSIAMIVSLVVIITSGEQRKKV